MLANAGGTGEGRNLADLVIGSCIAIRGVHGGPLRHGFAPGDVKVVDDRALASDSPGPGFWFVWRAESWSDAKTLLGRSPALHHEIA